MKPISPVLDGFKHLEIVFAKDQPEYIPLPAIRTTDDSGTVITRWRMSWRERLRALWTGDVYLSLLTFNRPLQPILLSVNAPRLRVE